MGNRKEFENQRNILNKKNKKRVSKKNKKRVSKKNKNK